MKTNLPFPTILVGALAAALTGSLNAASAELTPEALLALERGPAGARYVAISNSADQVWVIQSSTNLLDWAEFEVFKVHNGRYRRALPAAAARPGEFFRAQFDPARQNIPSAISNALLLPVTNLNYAAPVLPASFSVPPIIGQDNMRPTNVTTDAGATLGRVLFYDKRLSTNQSIACASCHQQRNGFSDPRQFSVGFAGGLTGRNSMGLTHARWYQREHFFWDERAATLEEQVLQPIQNAVEMGMTLSALTPRLAAEPFYTNLFTAAFGSPDITSERIARALAQFVRSIVAVQSKYDQGVTNNFANFTPLENQGRQIFFGPAGGCAACHGTDNFVPGPAINNNGLEFPFVDPGLGGVTGNPRDNGKFKVPSLRNIALTAPYMHDGRFATLEQVVEFYNSGVVDNPNLSPPLRNPDGTVRRLNLTQPQKDALVAFLRTLTDPNLATDPKYADPFNYGD